MRRDMYAAMDGFARKILPVQPGDLVIFKVSGNRLFVVTSQHQSKNPNEESDTLGQWIGGLMSTNSKCEVITIWLDWVGYETFWTICRVPV